MKIEINNYFLSFDGEQIYYALNFDPEKELKTPLIFNYGLVCSQEHFKYQIEYLDSLNYPIILHDYRGHYQSSGKDKVENISFKNITDDINGILNHLNIKEAIFIGHSMGVNICLEMAKSYPEKVKKMILISGSAFPVQNVMFNSNIMDALLPKLKESLKKYPKLYSLFWSYSGWNPIIKKIIHQGGFNIKTVPNEFIEIYLNKLGTLGPNIFFRLMDEMSTHDILSHLQKIKQETLIIGGTNDKVIPNWLQRNLNDALKNSELYIVKNGSHVPQVDFPELINERIKYFLDN